MGKVSTTTQKDVEIYVNNDTNAVIERFEVAPSKRGGSYVAVMAKNGASETEVQNAFKQAFPDLSIISSSMHRGSHVLMTHTNGNVNELLEGFSQNAHQHCSKKLEKDKKWYEKIDLMRYRGHLGNVGQFFILGSAMGLNYQGKKKTRIDEHGKEVPKYSGDKLASTVLSIFGNGINSYYGVQKKEDKLRLEHTKGKVNKLFDQQGISVENIPKISEKVIPDAEKETPKTSMGKFHAWHQGYSIKTSNGVKLIGKYFYLLSGKKQQNSGNKYHGYLSIAAKISTLTGLDEDPYNLEKRRGPISWIREKSNSISGTLEWLGNLSLIYGSVADDNATKKVEVKGPLQYLLGKKVNPFQKDAKQWDWLQLIGALSVGVGFVFKMFSPFTQKKIDVAEFAAHTASGLAQVKAGEHSKAVADMTSELLGMEELPELRERRFAGTFAELADELAIRQNIVINAPQGEQAPAEMIAEAPAKATETEVTAPQANIEKKPSVASTIANAEREESLAARETAKQEAAEIATPSAAV